ncbi:MAG: metallophosphoesterase [Cyanobacteriota bacterium]|nr:metallophosphoesterase [Cyanobacteriota bacterium]
MSLKRRQFLGLSALGGLVLATGSQILTHMTSRGKDDDAIASSVSSVSSPLPPQPQPSADEPEARFASVADSGTGAEGQYAVARAMAQYHLSNPYPLVVLAGDNIYNKGEIEKVEAVFERPYEPLLDLGVRFYAALGNHDVRTENGDRQVEYPGFNMQGRYYTFRQGDVQFFTLDTNLYYVRNTANNPPGDAQLAWLQEELSRSDAPWKVVFGHHQIYSSGHYGVNRAFVEKFVPLFKQYRVQLYINGHDHHYERSKSIDGTTYLICGGGGARIRPVEQAEFSAYAESRLSFAAYEVYRDRIVIRGVGTDGQVFDEGVVLV